MVTDKTRRSAFIEQNLGLVHACAGRFRGRGIEYDDLYSAGCMGLVKATDGFDEGRGVCFSTYAVPVILGEIKKLFREGGTVKVSRSLKELGLRVNAARERQRERLTGTGITCNANIPPRYLAELCRLSPPARELLRIAFDKLGLSARAYDRVLKVSRTIADLEDSRDILPQHAAEAVQYRSLDRKYWTREL